MAPDRCAKHRSAVNVAGEQWFGDLGSPAAIFFVGDDR
jgi:hypothetical protein